MVHVDTVLLHGRVGVVSEQVIDSRLRESETHLDGNKGLSTDPRIPRIAVNAMACSLP